MLHVFITSYVGGATQQGCPWSSFDFSMPEQTCGMEQPPLRSCLSAMRLLLSVQLMEELTV